MTAMQRVIDVIHNADAAGSMLPADLLAQSGLDRETLAEAVRYLATHGRVRIDPRSGAVSLTAAARHEATAPAPDAGSKAEPAGFALAEGDPGRPPEMTPGLGSAPQPPEPGQAPIIVTDAPSAPAVVPAPEPLLGRPGGQGEREPRPRARRASPVAPVLSPAATDAAVRQAKDVALAVVKRRAARAAQGKTGVARASQGKRPAPRTAR